jgi:hypothetical protein
MKRVEFLKNTLGIDKGTSLTTDKVVNMQKLLENFMSYFTVYPDVYIDIITPAESKFTLYFYQRIFLRASMRYRYHYVTAPRAFSKSFLGIMALYLRCVFLPGSKVFICAPVKEQSIKIAREKITEIFNLFPLLEKELVSKNFSSDEIRLTFKNGSVFDIVSALNSQRGGRRHAGIIDEVRDHDQDMLNAVVLPLLNVSRRTANGDLNPHETQQSQLFITSAGTKGSYAYEKQVELFQKSILAPKSAFVWGCDYRIPVLHGVISKEYMEDIKTSGTFKEEDFAREYLSVWTGGSSDSWFDYDRIAKYRKIVNPENKAIFSKGNQDAFYILSVDVARMGDAQSVVCVFKVLPRDTYYLKKLVNIKVLTEMHFGDQALELKRMINYYSASKIIVDGNGLGAGLLDFMIIPTLDPKTKEILPAIGSYNDADLLAMQPKDCKKIMYVIKANQALNSEIHATCFTELQTGKVRFLIREREAKDRLLATKLGQKMKVEDRIRRLMPYEMTTRLHEEMANLKIKSGGSVQNIVLERINSKMPKDKFSAFEYGLWLIKGIEDAEMKKKSRKRKNNISDFLMMN